MQIRDMVFYTPDPEVAKAANNGCYGTGTTSCDTAKLDLSVSDVVDTLNPLEHIPFISTLYNEMTGNKPSAGAQIAGGTIYGGPIGLIMGAVDAAFEGESGHDILGSAYAALTGDNTNQYAKNTGTETIQTADATATNRTALPTDTALDEIIQTPNAEILPPTKSGNMATMGVGATAQQQRAQDVLSLFDAPNAAAHSAYRRTQSLTAPTSTAAAITM